MLNIVRSTDNLPNTLRPGTWRPILAAVCVTSIPAYAASRLPALPVVAYRILYFRVQKTVEERYRKPLLMKLRKQLLATMSLTLIAILKAS